LTVIAMIKDLVDRSIYISAGNQVFAEDTETASTNERIVDAAIAYTIEAQELAKQNTRPRAERQTSNIIIQPCCSSIYTDAFSAQPHYLVPHGSMYGTARATAN